ncbi:DUF6225 family protein [Streptomyces sp. NPDC014779]|uniref:DUF6225 family protein n=1 Tax=unclassified Streptomyces TaxID=2593676 RepID=UPI0036F6F80B
MSEHMKPARYRHETVELTAGELLEALRRLPADAPVRIDVPSAPRTAETRDEVDSGHGHFVVSGVVLHDADHLHRDEVVLRADFASDWYVRPVAADEAG